MTKRACILAAVLSATSLAQEPTPAPAPKPPPYSVPWQLRPTAAGNVIRLDSALASRELPDGTGAWTSATMLFAAYQVIPNLAPFVRLGFVADFATATNTSLVNPAVGATWSLPLGNGLRTGLFLGLTVPVGMGGGNEGDAGSATAARAGIQARSAMDNAMFAVNDFTVFPGVGLSWTGAGFTAQVEATLLQLTRVRGEAVQTDATKTNLTSGLHLGYFVHPQVSLGAELRYQRWLVPPAAVTTDAQRDNLTAAAGVRAHFKSGALTFRPGVSFTLPLDDPMGAQAYRIFQLDVPVAF